MHESVQLKITNRNCQDYCDNLTKMYGNDIKPPEVNQEAAENRLDLVNIPLQTTMSVGALGTQLVEMMNTTKVESVKNVEDIDGIMSMKELEQNLPMKTIRSIKSDIRIRTKRVNEDDLAKITSSQRAICAVIDRILWVEPHYSFEFFYMGYMSKYSVYYTYTICP